VLIQIAGPVAQVRSQLVAFAGCTDLAAARFDVIDEHPDFLDDILARLRLIDQLFVPAL
jgi:hypothetical protein